VQRDFPIPPDLTNGKYEIVAEIWPATQIGDRDVETYADSPCETFAVQ
jgi:hypothetical protein